MKKLPIGISNLQQIVEDGYVYVDKSRYVYQLAESGKYYFLSRPRRFGKSLFIDTLKEALNGYDQIPAWIYNRTGTRWNNRSG